MLASTAEGPDDEHDAEGSTVGFERQRTSALLTVARSELEALATAAARVREGSYGTCSSCGDPIGAERLEALPAATACVACARRGGTAIS